MGATLRALKRDAARYAKVGGWLRHEGFWIGAVYRAGVWAQTLPLPLRLPTLAVHRAVQKVWCKAICHVDISTCAKIGPGLYLIHPRNIYIPPTEIGRNFTVFQEVTLGANGDPPTYPTIGDNVVVFVGARVLGGVAIGDEARIGANTVVTRDVGPGSVVLPGANRVLSPSMAEAFGVSDSLFDSVPPPTIR